ncbi:MAG: hypothetical protein SFU86_21360 [Pirellulaceae bacterium]|nr:hypothetical protein [Pirellulaceae bacterium]
MLRPTPLLKLLLALAATSATAAEPAIRNLNLRGLAIGSTTTLAFDGDDLTTTPKLLLPFAGQAELKPGNTDKKAEFAVTPAADVPPGYYQLRLVTDGGASLPVIVGVDKLPQLPFGKTVESLPAALHGTASGSGIQETTFTGKAGQKLIAEVEAQRIGSKLRPVVHLIGPERRQIGWSWPAPALFGDTRLEATLPADGTYTLTIHDLEYAAPNPSFFRLKLGQWSYVDHVFPSGVAKGQTQVLELIGAATTKLELPGQAAIGVLPLDWPQEGLWSGPRPFVTVSSTAETIEQATPAPPTGQELPAGLVAVSGRLAAPFEEDRYRVPVVPGSKLKLEVLAERTGSPLDVALIVRNDKGAPLARGEDSPGTIDPVLEYAVPADVNSVTIGVADALGRGGPRGAYRLLIDPQSPGETRSDFLLITAIQRIAIPDGGRMLVPILAERRGYAEPIDLSAARLPAGVKLDNVTIPAGADGTLLTITRGEEPAEATIAALAGKTSTGDERTVAIKDHPLARLQPWLASEIAFAPTSLKATDYAIDWGDLAADAALVPTAKLTLPVKLVRPDENTAVRLTLVTSQIEPLNNNRPDPARTLRLEKAVEIAPKMATGEAVVLVPAELASPVYDLSLQAEFLSADKKTVLATSFAPVRRMEVRRQVLLTLEGGPKFEATLDPKAGATVTIAGKLERREGFTGDVTLALTGPAAVTATIPPIKADASDFTLTLKVPANQPVGEIPLKLAGTFVPDPKQANVRVKTLDLDFTLVLEASAN